MKYFSTRNDKGAFSAAQAMAMGLAQDGGLFVPETIPSVSAEELKALCAMDYRARAVNIMQRFLTDFTEAELQDFVTHAYAENFDSPAVAPLRFTDDATAYLELWHGPTCAFKDMALQMLPYLLTASLKKTGEEIAGGRFGLVLRNAAEEADAEAVRKKDAAIAEKLS